MFVASRRNLLPNITNDYISTCAYLPDRDPDCPVFVLGDILNKAESDPNEQALMLQKVSWTDELHTSYTF